MLKITHVNYTQSWRKNALEYIEKTSPKHISVWDWYCLSASDQTWKDIPWVQGKTAERNQDVYSSLGAEYVFYDHGPTESYFEDESSFALRWPLWYVASKLAWDASLSAQDILRDACDKLYGEAAKEMYKYYMLLAGISENCTSYSNTWVPPTIRQMYYNNTAPINAVFAQIQGKYDQLTEQQIERIENQKAYWENVLKYTK
ncbi:MAG TPA: DUF4838 domain-containing protein [Bacillota bacterium]|nr:DUF4838 domain-containing protein [Bacillota bacterium]